jgi:hypothetical protein
MNTYRNTNELLSDLKRECPEPTWAELHHGPHYSVRLGRGLRMSHSKRICDVEYMLLSWYFSANDIRVRAT